MYLTFLLFFVICVCIYLFRVQTYAVEFELNDWTSINYFLLRINKNVRWETTTFSATDFNRELCFESFFVCNHNCIHTEYTYVYKLNCLMCIPLSQLFTYILTISLHHSRIQIDNLNSKFVIKFTVLRLICPNRFHSVRYEQ